MKRKSWRLVAAALCCAGLFVVVPAVWAGQTELDRIVARVNGKIITQSDVRQARALKLVGDTSSDDATRRELENRLLMLGELSRSSVPPASDADLDSGRRRWQNAVGSANVSQALTQAAMGEADLQNWIRDDIRIEAYLKRQFAAIPESDRQRAINDWLTRLRQRAGLE